MTSHHDVAGVVAELRGPLARSMFLSKDHMISHLIDQRETARSALEAQAKALSDAQAERDLLRKYCSAAATDYFGVLTSMRTVVGHQLADAFNALAAELTETSEFMRLAAEGRANGLLYDDEWSKARARALAAESRLADKEAELSIARQINHDLTDGITGTLQKDKIESLEARLAEAMKVIEPFGILASAYFSKYETRPGEFVESYSGKPDAEPIFTFNGTPITYGHLRAARAFTNAAKEKTDAND